MPFTIGFYCLSNVAVNVHEFECPVYDIVKSLSPILLDWIRLPGIMHYRDKIGICLKQLLSAI